jgi:hypothetical protein
MKKLLLFVFALPFSNALMAQDYVPLQVSSGYNADVIANGVGPSLLSINSSFDNANYALMSADFQPTLGDIPPAYALPISGTINNASMPGLSYQLASYSSDNSLHLVEEFDFGSLAISNGVPATTLYVLAATGSGTATLGGTIHFSDNTTQEIASGVIPDWFFSDALPVVISEFGRVNTTTDAIENPIGDPRLYQFQIEILPANQTKTITAIDFTKLSPQEGVLNIFAVSAQELGTCPAPTQLTATNITNISATINWTTPAILPANGYEYYISTNNTTPTPATTPTGSVSAGLNSVNITALAPGVTYCVWLRSICSGTEVGPWGGSTCFTPGQIPVTNPNDIPTLYSLTVDVNSTTTCPGTLSLTVPAGYIITSVDTSYDMQTALNGWMSEQRSILVCNTTGMMESDVTSGVGGTSGTYSYSRTGLGIANGASGTVEFELRAWRTYGSSDCNTDYNRVVAGTWTVTATVQLPFATKDFTKNNFTVYPNPADDVLNISGNEMISEIALYNVLGQQILHQNGLNAKATQVSTSGLPGGKYLLKITSESGVQSKGILKN